MSVSSVSQVKQNYFQNGKAQINEAKKEIKQIENGKKKILLALAGLSAVALAGIEVYKHKNIVKKQTEKINEIIKQTGAKIKGLIKKEDLPVDNKTVNITTKSGKQLGTKGTYKKYSAEYKGRDVVVEHKLINADNLDNHGGNFAVIRDLKTNELVEIKPVTPRGDERPLIKKPEVNKVKLKTTEKLFDEQGSEVINTKVNGKTKAITTIKKKPDGSKEIVVNYGKGGSGSEFGSDKDYQKIITILPDGTRTVTKKGRPILN